MNNWLKFDDAELSDYLNRELETTDKGQVKSTATNLITVLVNPSFCKEQSIISGKSFLIEEYRRPGSNRHVREDTGF